MDSAGYMEFWQHVERITKRLWCMGDGYSFRMWQPVLCGWFDSEVKEDRCMVGSMLWLLVIVWGLGLCFVKGLLGTCVGLCFVKGFLVTCVGLYFFKCYN